MKTLIVKAMDTPKQTQVEWHLEATLDNDTVQTYVFGHDVPLEDAVAEVKRLVAAFEAGQVTPEKPRPVKDVVEVGAMTPQQLKAWATAAKTKVKVG